ncbi:hypothetical protein Hanom_Chr13g01209531 [Helianthus anomalus]
MGEQSDSQMKIEKGDYGYVLEDVPHLTDYIPNLIGWLIMHHVVALIAERQGVTCTNWPLSQLLSVMPYVQGLM